MPRVLLVLPLAALAGCDLLAPVDKAHGTDPGDSGTYGTITGGGTTTGGGTNVQVGDDGILSCNGMVPRMEVDCEADYPTPNPGHDGLPSCTTDVLRCGDTVTGTLEGGSEEMDNGRGHVWEWCSGHSTGSQLAGPERAYRVEVPADSTFAKVRVASCEPVQVLWYQVDDACPAAQVACSYAVGAVDGRRCQGEDIVTGGAGVMYVVVESLNGSSGNYTLYVDCGT